MKRKAFTLVELLVVLAVVIILVSVSVPAIRSMMRSNAQAQAINLIRAQLSTARTVALSQHRQAGVVFFEEVPIFDNSTPPKLLVEARTGQTAMQIMVASSDQTGAGPGFTIFNYYSREREYLPVGIKVASLNDDASKQILTGDNTGGNSRIVMFDEKGQLIMRTGIARPDNTGTADGGYPKAYTMWNVATKSGTASEGVSSPGVVVYSMKDYNDAGLTTDAAKAAWIQQHADILVVNAYTGNIIR